MITTDLTVLDQNLRNFYEEFLRAKDLDLSTTVLRDPKPDAVVQFDISSFRKPEKFSLKEKMMLGILHWYFSKEIRFSINLWLERHWGQERKEVKEVLLNSKRTALGWLKIQTDFNDSDFYGNYLKQNNFSAFFRLKFQSDRKRKVKRYTGWCRGPQDHCSRVQSHWSRTKIRLSTEWTNQEIDKEMEFQILVDSLFDEISEFYNSISA